MSLVNVILSNIFQCIDKYKSEEALHSSKCYPFKGLIARVKSENKETLNTNLHIQ